MNGLDIVWLITMIAGLALFVPIKALVKDEFKRPIIFMAMGFFSSAIIAEIINLLIALLEF